MICSCPKCHAHIEVDLSNMPESGTFTSCPECKGRFWINKESYARTALKKEGKTYCDKCNNELDHVFVCRACGAMYPDYYLVQTSKPLRRQVEKVNYFSSSFSLKPANLKYTHTYSYTAAKESRTKSPQTLFKVVGFSAIIILLAVSAGYFYKVNQAEKQYAHNFMRALFTIKTGTDLSLNTCAKISADWKSSLDAGHNYTPHINVETKTKLIKVKDATDNFMQRLNKTPKKFTIAKDKLSNLYSEFSKAQTLAIAPSGSFSNFADSANKTETKFNKAVSDLKSSLPPELSAELKIAKTKYRSLKDI